MVVPRRDSPLPADLLEFARELRGRQTDAEQLIWSLFRGRRFLGLKFRRQHPCPPDILDFYCDELRLAVELDGGQHNSIIGITHDVARSDFLEKCGITVLRFWNHDVLTDPEAILVAIYQHVLKAEATRV